jgi:hypothetical protein
MLVQRSGLSVFQAAIPAVIALAVAASEARAEGTATSKVHVQTDEGVTVDLSIDGVPLGSCSRDCRFEVRHGALKVQAHGESTPSASADLKVGGATAVRVRAGSDGTKTVGQVLWVSGIIEGVIGTGGALMAMACRGGDCPQYHSSSTDIAAFGTVAVVGLASTIFGILLDTDGSTRIDATPGEFTHGLRWGITAGRSGGGVGLAYAF